MRSTARKEGESPPRSRVLRPGPANASSSRAHHRQTHCLHPHSPPLSPPSAERVWCQPLPCRRGWCHPKAPPAWAQAPAPKEGTQTPHPLLWLLLLSSPGAPGVACSEWGPVVSSWMAVMASPGAKATAHSLTRASWAACVWRGRLGTKVSASRDQGAVAHTLPPQSRAPEAPSVRGRGPLEKERSQVTTWLRVRPGLCVPTSESPR